MDLAFDPTPRDREAERARLDARLDSILNVAGQGPILEPDPADHAAAAEAAVLRAARTDWRAAAWLVGATHPKTRQVWSDAARIVALYRSNTAPRGGRHRTMGKGSADPTPDRSGAAPAPAGRRDGRARRGARLMDPTTRSVLLRTLAAIDASNLPPELEQRLLQELAARFPDLPEGQG
jgi:hypothetical protein